MTIRVQRKAADAYQHGDLREALIQAGLKLLSEGGVEGLGLRAAAQLAGVSHAAPYRHFRDKDALVAAIAERGFRLLTQAMRDEVAGSRSRDVASRLRAIGQGYVAFALAHPAYFRVIFGGLVPTEAHTAELLAAGEEAFGVLRGLVAEGVADGTLRQADPNELSLTAWALVHGLSMLALGGQLGPMSEKPEAMRKIAGTMLQFLSEGVARRP